MKNEKLDEDQQQTGTQVSMVESIVRGEIDMQISTARAYPRSLAVFKKRVMDMATLDEETAESCFYALPRGGKTVEGPSSRLSEIVAAGWEHLRVEGRSIAEEEDYVLTRGTAWDMQTNVAFSVEVRRRITDSKGRRYNADMITVTTNAGISIAMRNATLKVVPSAYWRPVYDKCVEIIKGNLDTLADRRVIALDHFQKLGVSRARIYSLLEVMGEEDITLEHLVTLRGLNTALKQGETTIDQAFPAPTQQENEPQRKSEAAKTDQPADESKPKKQSAKEAKAETGAQAQDARVEALRAKIEDSSDEELKTWGHREFVNMCGGVPSEKLAPLLLKYNARRVEMNKKKE